MSISLSDLQENFSLALHYQATGDDCNIESDYLSADERMQIYRNNFVIGLSEILSATYPITEKLVGEDCFAGLARQHVLNKPLERADVSIYGEGFAETIAQTEAVISAVPYLADVALFEWKRDLATQAYNSYTASKPLRPFTELSQLSPQQQQNIIIHPNNTLNLIKSDYALFSLQQAVNSGDFEHLNINDSEQGLVFCPNGLETVTHSLCSDEFCLLEKLCHLTPISKVEPNLLAHLNSLLVLDIFVGFELSND